MKLTTYEVLKAARDWLADRKNWIQHRRRGVGSKSIPDPPRCMLGAIDRVLWGPGQPTVMQQWTTDQHPAVAALALECQTAAGYFPAVQTTSIVAAFNDSADYAGVLALLDLALRHEQDRTAAEVWRELDLARALACSALMASDSAYDA
jgi:hypothetical protein